MSVNESKTSPTFFGPSIFGYKPINFTPIKDGGYATPTDEQLLADKYSFCGCCSADNFIIKLMQIEKLNNSDLIYKDIKSYFPDNSDEKTIKMITGVIIDYLNRFSPVSSVNKMNNPYIGYAEPAVLHALNFLKKYNRENSHGYIAFYSYCYAYLDLPRDFDDMLSYIFMTYVDSLTLGDISECEEKEASLRLINHGGGIRCSWLELNGELFKKYCSLDIEIDEIVKKMNSYVEPA